MDVTETIQYAPAMMRVLCYLSGMGVFLSVLFWIGCMAFGYRNRFGLRRTVGLWLVRSLAACALFSLLLMASSWRGFVGPAMALPEFSVLLLVAALYLLWAKERPQNWEEILRRRLPKEVTKIILLGLGCIFAWAISIALGLGIFMFMSVIAAPPWFAVFLIGLMWNAPLVVFFLKAEESGNTGGIKFYHLLWPVLLAYLIIMLPDFAEHLANSPKIHEFLNAHPHPRRA